MRYITVTTTTSSAEEARTIARTLVTERLAACVQRLPVESCYAWRGEVVDEPEQLLVIKTTAERYEEVETKIRELHSYEIPEIVALTIERGLGGYLAWIDGVVA